MRTLLTKHKEMTTIVTANFHKISETIHFIMSPVITVDKT